MLPLPACTRLRRACLDNDVAVVEEVLDGAAATGAGVGATASVLVLPWDRRATACHWAALSDSVAVLDCLRSRFGVDAFALHNGVGESAMHWACRAGAAAAVKWLAALSPTAVEEEDALGRRPLHWAAGSGHAALVRWLIAAGASTHARCSMGYSAMYRACDAGHFGVMACIGCVGGWWELDGEVRESCCCAAAHVRRCLCSALFTTLCCCCCCCCVGSVGVQEAQLRDAMRQHHNRREHDAVATFVDVRSARARACSHARAHSLMVSMFSMLLCGCTACSC
jgi:hypothetical protein